jgi:hypothetical protein
MPPKNQELGLLTNTHPLFRLLYTSPDEVFALTINGSLWRPDELREWIFGGVSWSKNRVR